MKVCMKGLTWDLVQWSEVLCSGMSDNKYFEVLWLY